ncbi:solute carrier family 23 member 3 [Pelodytes ibericus]
MSCICCGTKASRLKSYNLHHNPPWLLSFFFAVQHILVLASMLCTCHHLLLQIRPLPPTYQSRLLASSLFTCGIATALQSSLGTRLPLAQAPTFELLIPALTLSQHQAGNGTSRNDTLGSRTCTDRECDQLKDTLHSVTEVSGAVLVSGILQVLFGVTGLWGWILTHCGPMVKAPALSILGLSCYKQAALFCSFNWVISLTLILVAGLLSQTLRSCYFPICTWKAKEGVKRRYIPILRMLSLLLTISGAWVVCSYLRAVDERLGLASSVRSANNGSTLGLADSLTAFTSDGLNVTDLTSWFQIPSLGGLGWPQFSLQSLSVGVSMALTSSLSSLGCYILFDRMLQCPPVPPQACNRGICMEGVGNVLSGLLGSICGAGSSIPNIGMTGITQVGCRHSVQICAFLLVVLGCSPWLSQLLMDIPFAVHGAVLCLTYGMALGGGISFFQYADIDSGRNIFNLGFAIFSALLVPRWLDSAPGILRTGWLPLDLFLVGILTVPIFLGGLFSFVLDNTVSGTLKERGLLPSLTRQWSNPKWDTPSSMNEEVMQAYGLPLIKSSLFPTVYPFTQLCLPVSDLVEVVHGEDDKLLTAQ